MYTHTRVQVHTHTHVQVHTHDECASTHTHPSQFEAGLSVKVRCLNIAGVILVTAAQNTKGRGQGLRAIAQD